MRIGMPGMGGWRLGARFYQRAIMDRVMTDPAALIADFSDAAGKVGIAGWPCPIRLESTSAPHQKPRLPPGQAAVYVFALSAAYGHTATRSSRTVLKVGKVGAGNEPRFRDDHYKPRARGISTLAQSLLAYPILWPWLGITHLDEATVAAWMFANLDRTHFFIPAGHDYVLAALEVYVRGRTGSVFEGASHRGKGAAIPLGN
jgi:hypothetical protein